MFGELRRICLGDHIHVIRVLKESLNDFFIITTVSPKHIQINVCMA